VYHFTAIDGNPDLLRAKRKWEKKEHQSLLKVRLLGQQSGTPCPNPLIQTELCFLDLLTMIQAHVVRREKAMELDAKWYPSLSSILTTRSHSHPLCPILNLLSRKFSLAIWQKAEAKAMGVEVELRCSNATFLQESKKVQCRHLKELVASQE